MSHDSPQRAPERVVRGEHVIAHRILVHAPADQLYEIIANPHRHHELDGSGTVKTSAIAPRELHPRDRFRVDMRKYGIPYALTMVTTKAEPHRLLEWRHPAGHRWRWELQPEGDATLVTESYDFTRQPAPVKQLLHLVKAHQDNDRGIRASLQKLHDRFAQN